MGTTARKLIRICPLELFSCNVFVVPNQIGLIETPSVKKRGLLAFVLLSDIEKLIGIIPQVTCNIDLKAN